MSEKGFNFRMKISLIIRILVLALSITAFTITFTQWAAAISGGTPAIEVIGNSISFYTIQSNILVLAWVAIAIPLMWKKENKFFHSILHGGVNVYITITLVIFAILLSPLYKPTDPLEITNNILFHYLIPSLFIFDWFVTNFDRKYDWKYAIYWLIYPICYLVYTLIRGNDTGTYPYPFLNLNVLGVGGLAISVVTLAGIYILLGVLFVATNKKLQKFARNTAL